MKYELYEPKLNLHSTQFQQKIVFIFAFAFHIKKTDAE